MCFGIWVSFVGLELLTHFSTKFIIRVIFDYYKDNSNGSKRRTWFAKKVLLFGDIGIDDTVALIYARLNQEIEIVGLVADYGNVSREDAVSNIYYVMKLFDFPQGIPVILGAEVPLTGEQPTYYPEIHGERGLDPSSQMIITN